MAKKKAANLTFATPNPKFKRYHKLYLKNIINTERHRNTNTMEKKNRRGEIIVVEFITFGVLALNSLRLPLAQLEACKKIAKRIFKKKGSILPRVYTSLPLTKKPSETRMGKGKSSRVSEWVCPVKPGKIVFELRSNHYDLVRQVFKCICDRLPIKLKLIDLKI